MDTRMDNDQLLKAVRAMAWNRAKGELRAYLSTFFPKEDMFPEYKRKIDSFIKYMEDSEA